MKFYGILITTLFFCACTKKKKDLVFFERSEAQYTKLVNQKPAPSNVNLSVEKVLVNDDYPLELALFQDGRFYYNLDNLGDGYGTWKYHDGVIKLYSQRKILGTVRNLDYQVISQDEPGTQFGIKFRDRHGPRYLELKVTNL